MVVGKKSHIAINPDRNPHPKNVPGDFYVVDSCCLMCGVPDSFSTLFGELESHCYVKKQPITEIEEQNMLEVMEIQDLDCIRYKGTNQTILEMLQAQDCGYLCDHLEK